MKVVLLIQSPVATTSYEHGLELAMTMADMEMDVAVLFADSAADNIIAFDDDRVKKVGQLNLFDIKSGLYCDKTEIKLDTVLDFLQLIDKEQFTYILRSADKVVRF